jgi:hypothetical protein
MSKKQVRWDEGQVVTVPDNNGKVRSGTLEILSSQVFVQFPEGDGVFMTHTDFKKEAKRNAA